MIRHKIISPLILLYHLGCIHTQHADDVVCFGQKPNNTKAGRAFSIKKLVKSVSKVVSNEPNNIKGSSLVLLPILLPEKCVVTYFVT